MTNGSQVEKPEDKCQPAIAPRPSWGEPGT